jgi:hypothetical protein
VCVCLCARVCVRGVWWCVSARVRVCACVRVCVCVLSVHGVYGVYVRVCGVCDLWV